MCYDMELTKKDKNRYWIFNKEVTKKVFDNRWFIGFKEKPKVCDKCGHEIKE